MIDADIDVSQAHALTDPEHTPYHVPIVARGERIGILLVGPKLEDSEDSLSALEFLANLMPVAATALNNGFLVHRLEQQIKALAERERVLAALSERLIVTEEEERRKIALDLHDDPLQRAILLLREMENADSNRQWLDKVEEIIVSLRAICNGIIPSLLEDLGLAAGLEWLVNDFCARSNSAACLILKPDGELRSLRLNPKLEIALYRVAQEALQNCLKHAHASNVVVELRREQTQLLLLIIDDGLGFRVNGSGHQPTKNLGIMGMHERLRPWDGRVIVMAGDVRGTIVRAEVTLPYERAVPKRSEENPRCLSR